MKKLIISLVAFVLFSAQAGIKKEPAPKSTGEPEAGQFLEELLNSLLSGGDRKLDTKLNSHFRELLDGHKPGTVAVAEATYAVRDAKKTGIPLAFATGVNAAGWMITKASEVKGVEQLQVELRKEWVRAKVVRQWDEHDLALIKVEATDIGVAQWVVTPPEVGTFITAAAPAGQDPVAIGVVSVATRSIRAQGRGFLGVQVASDEKGLKVQMVLSKSAAEKSGVKANDRIVELDGVKPDTVFGFTKSISNRKAGEKVRLKLQRDQAFVEFEIALGDLASKGIVRESKRSMKMNAMGSTVSERRGDFPSVIQTDFPLDASQCGGPVTDLDGNVLGIVIARSGRIETLVLPSEAIVSALKAVDFSK